MNYSIEMTMMFVVFVQRCRGGSFSLWMSSKVENKQQVELERVLGS
jgi:hypothetical protein